MSIKANFLRDVYGNITVQMNGDFDYEYSDVLGNQLQELAKHHPETKVTIDMAGIDFVGSSGISHFVETLRGINKNRSTQMGLANVKPEFKRIFKLYTENEHEILIEEFDWENNETKSMGMFALRHRTFEN